MDQQKDYNNRHILAAISCIQEDAHVRFTQVYIWSFTVPDDGSVLAETYQRHSKVKHEAVYKYI